MLWVQSMTHFSVIVRVSSGTSHTYPPHLTTDWNNNLLLSVVSIAHIHTYWQSTAKLWQRVHPIWCLHIIWHYLFHVLNRYHQEKRSPAAGWNCLRGRGGIFRWKMLLEGKTRQEPIAYGWWLGHFCKEQGAETQALGKREIQAFFLNILEGTG